MSLIHKMLQELEEQSKKNNGTPSFIQPALSHKSQHVSTFAGFLSRANNIKILLPISVGVLLAMLLAIYAHMQNHAEKTLAHSTWNHNASIKTAIPMHSQDKSNFLYQEAIDLIQSGNTEEAMVDLQAAIQSDATFVKAREALIVLLIQNNHLNQASNSVNQGLALSPHYVPFLELKARILITQLRYEEALDFLTKNAVSLRKHPDYYELMAVAYDDDTNYMAAAKIYQELVDLEPYNGNWWFGLGVSLQNAGKLAAATEAFQKALAAGGLTSKIRAYLEIQLQQTG